MRLCASIFLLACFLVATPVSRASACSPAFIEDGWVTPPSLVGEQCAFDVWPNPTSHVVAGKVFALGPMTVAQRIDYWSLSTSETLLVVDCGTGDVVQIYGRNDWAERKDSCGQSRHVRRILAPDGHIRLTKKTTVDRLRRISDAFGYHYREGRDVLNPISGSIPFGPHCGCKVLYPNSLGANLSAESERG